MNSSADTIGMVLPSLAHGGAQKVFVELYLYWRSQQHNVSMLCLDRQGELLARGDTAIDFLSSGEPGGWWVRLRQMVLLRRWVKAKGITALYSTVTGMNLFVACCFLFDRQVRIVLREATPLENNRSRWLRLGMWLLYRRADKLICTSPYVLQQMQDRTLARREALVYIPNPLDVAAIQTAARAPLPADYGEPAADCWQIVAVGRLVYAKGFDILLHAIAELQQQIPVYLVVVGDGPEREELEALTRRLELDSQVLFVGYQANPFVFMQRADLYVLSSRWEGYVNTVIEAMALGLRIVATDCNSGPGELLKRELGQSLAIPEDPQSLALAMGMALTTGATPDYTLLLRRHRMDAVAAQYLELL